MDTLTLDGTTIRGVVNGRKINCVISSSPAGLTLPRGQYVLRAEEKNAVYGQLLSIEPAQVGGGSPGGGQASAIRASGDFHIKFGSPDAPTGKFFDSANTAGTSRVTIAAKPIGQASLVAREGFSDLAEIVQRAGEVTLIVA